MARKNTARKSGNPTEKADRKIFEEKEDFERQWYKVRMMELRMTSGNEGKPRKLAGLRWRYIPYSPS